MRPIHLGDVLGATGARLAGSPADPRLTGVSTDTRTLAAGELFVALSGPSFDGNRFAGEAARRGAGALLLRADGDGPPPAFDVPVLLHSDPRRALAALAAWYRSRIDCPVIGITGSCGKTTTKDVLRDLLSRLFPTAASPSSYNNDVGVPLSIFLADETTRALVVELGTNHAGEIAALARIAQPTAGVITNVGASHLEGLGSLEGVAREKGDLAAVLPRAGFCVLNADCRFTPQIRERTAARVLTFSVEGAAGGRGDLDATDLLFHSAGTTFRLNGFEVTSPLLGTHNVQNVLAALAVCVGLGIELQDVLPGVPLLRGGRRRMERIDLSDVVVFDDTYNSNPESLRAAVRVLAGLHGHRRRLLVLGDMLELGERGAELHHRVGREAAEAGIDVLVLVGELVRASAAGALEAGLAEERVLHLESARAAARAVDEVAGAGDVVLVKGSRRMRMEEVVQALVERRGPPPQEREQPRTPRPQAPRTNGRAILR